VGTAGALASFSGSGGGRPRCSSRRRRLGYNNRPRGLRRARSPHRFGTGPAARSRSSCGSSRSSSTRCARRSSSETSRSLPGSALPTQPVRLGTRLPRARLAPGHCKAGRTATSSTGRRSRTCPNIACRRRCSSLDPTTNPRSCRRTVFDRRGSRTSSRYTARFPGTACRSCRSAQPCSSDLHSPACSRCCCSRLDRPRRCSCRPHRSDC